ncbi:MAG: formylmethanofuran dehydrogenase subunit B [Pirellulales bacterium]|nr:formylmethanofuran dehydrogenase subunit B [Pirellulales bacterium]
MTPSQPAEISAAQTYVDVPCTVCGCVCDDLQVSVADDRIVPLSGACPLAEPWFAVLSEALANPPPLARIEGKPVSLHQAVERAAYLLSRSRAPLVWGLSRSSTAGQRAAVALAERLGATIDTTASVCHGPSIMAIQQVGESTCSLGEVRHRADLVVFWGANPVNSHPRHFERYSADAIGQFTPRGRADRKLIVIDKQATATSELADEFIQVPADGDFEMIWALRQLLQGRQLPASFDIGVSHQRLRQLVQQLKGCRYGVVFFGLGLAQRGIGHVNVEALLQLVADLNDHTRFTARRLRIPGDVTGADAVLCWQTGFPFAVSMSRGYPRYNPGEYSANELLARGEVDACLLVGSEAMRDLSPSALRAAEQLPTIALDYPHLKSPIDATVQFTTAVYGIHAAGTVYRMDEIPIALRQLRPSNYPRDDEVLTAIAAALTGNGDIATTRVV